MSAGARSRGAASRTLELLQSIAAGDLEFALSELADRAGLAPSTAHRLLEPWVGRDLIERAGPKAYRVGPGLFRVASLIVRNYERPRIARTFLEALWRTWQETASFCLYKPATRTATVAESIASPHPLQYVLTPHSEIPLAWGSLGRAILAQLPPEEIRSVMAHDRGSPLSGKRLPSRRVFLQELRAIRQHGYAIYRDDVVNVAGVSAPVTDAAGAVIGSLGVTMPASRFGKSAQARLPRAVMDSARRLSAAFGAR